MTHMPLVSVVVPVYNYDQYLGECIESVLTQTYSNWELVVVNNCSTDRSGDIAEQYAQKDPRIRVHHNTEFVDTYRNHNIACRQIAPDSAYCKMLCADDWMFPECLERMVAVAQAHPTIGIVGAYRIDGVEVGCDGLPYPTPFISGRELGRLTLLGSVGVFGSGSWVLYRSECVRARPELYEEADNHADMARRRAPPPAPLRSRLPEPRGIRSVSGASVGPVLSVPGPEPHPVASGRSLGLPSSGVAGGGAPAGSKTNDQSGHALLGIRADAPEAGVGPGASIARIFRLGLIGCDVHAAAGSLHREQRRTLRLDRESRDAPEPPESE